MIKKFFEAADYIWENLNEAHEKIELAYKWKDVCKLEAEWQRDMAAKHLEFNDKGREALRSMMSMLEADQKYAAMVPGLRELHNDWLLKWMHKHARIKSMVDGFGR